MSKVANPIATPQPQGGAIVPHMDQFVDKVKRYSLPFFLTGAGAAGLLHMLQMRREAQKAEATKQPSNDILTVTIPSQKQANVFRTVLNWAKANKGQAATAVGAGGAAVALPVHDMMRAKPVEPQVPTNYLLDAGFSTAAIAGASMLGYTVMDKILQRRRKAQLESQLDKSKGEYGALLGNMLAPKTASSLDNLYPVTFGLCCAMADDSFPPEELQKTATNPIATLVSFPSALAVVTGILAHKYMYNRQKELASLHDTSKPTPPKEIRLVSAPPPQLEAPSPHDDFDETEAKAASILLGGLVAGNAIYANRPPSPDTPPGPVSRGAAFVSGALTPGGTLVHGAIADRRNQTPFTKSVKGSATTKMMWRSLVGTILGGAGGAAAGAAISSAAGVGPIGAIPGLLGGAVVGGGIGGVMGANAYNKEQGFDDEKRAELTEWLNALATPTPQPKQEEPAPTPLTAPKAVEVGPGTVAMETTSGPVTIEAYDPQAAQALRRNTGRLKKLLAVLQVQPSQPAAA